MTEGAGRPGLWSMPGDGVLARQGDLVLLSGVDEKGLVDKLLGVLAETSDSGGDGRRFAAAIENLLQIDETWGSDQQGPAVVAFGPAGAGVVAVVSGGAWVEVATGQGTDRLAASQPSTVLRCVVGTPVQAIRAGLGAGGASGRTDRFSFLERGSVRAGGLSFRAGVVPAPAVAEPVPAGEEPADAAGSDADVAGSDADLAGSETDVAGGDAESAEAGAAPLMAAEPAPPAAEPAVPAAAGELPAAEPAVPAAAGEPPATTAEPALPAAAEWQPPAAPEPGPAAARLGPPAAGPALPATGLGSPAGDFGASAGDFGPAAEQAAPVPAGPPGGVAGRPMTEVAQIPGFAAGQPAPVDEAAPPPHEPTGPADIPPLPMAGPLPAGPGVPLAGPGVPLAGSGGPSAGPGAAQGPPIVIGVYCKNGHFGDPEARSCAVCGVSNHRRAQVPQPGPRPPLGALILADGSVMPLDTDYVIGREPGQDPAVTAGEARPLRLVDSEMTVSRVHARIHLEGWQVFLIDLGSANGTRIQLPGRRADRELAPNVPVPLQSGTEVFVGTQGFRYQLQPAAARL